MSLFIGVISMGMFDGKSFDRPHFTIILLLFWYSHTLAHSNFYMGSNQLSLFLHRSLSLTHFLTYTWKPTSLLCHARLDGGGKSYHPSCEQRHS
jgi:hypothetical protein